MGIYYIFIFLEVVREFLVYLSLWQPFVHIREFGFGCCGVINHNQSVHAHDLKIMDDVCAFVDGILQQVFITMMLLDEHLVMYSTIRHVGFMSSIFFNWTPTFKWVMACFDNHQKL